LGFLPKFSTPVEKAVENPVTWLKEADFPLFLTVFALPARRTMWKTCVRRSVVAVV
jgi:hypothetical protein